MSDVSDWAAAFTTSVRSVFQGSDEPVQKIIVALLCRGHVLIEDVPGVGKTMLARAVAASIGGKYSQIQCTPDLLPADVLGVSIYNQARGEFEFREGPVMTNVLLVDEISRATPRTQSALLEAMAEGQVSVEGRSLPLPDPFLLIATESPVESEGTFPLPGGAEGPVLSLIAAGLSRPGGRARGHAPAATGVEPAFCGAPGR